MLNIKLKNDSKLFNAITITNELFEKRLIKVTKSLAYDKFDSNLFNHRTVNHYPADLIKPNVNGF
jgi:hypothetical protein